MLPASPLPHAAGSLSLLCSRYHKILEQKEILLKLRTEISIHDPHKRLLSQRPHSVSIEEGRGLWAC